MYILKRGLRLALACTLALGVDGLLVPHTRAENNVTLLQKQEADATKDQKDNDKPLAKEAITQPVLWRQPADIATLDLFNGQGGKDKMPAAPFVFVEEDKNGTNPKMDVRDANGKKWRVKSGEEARPEVVASRLLWAMGFYANDDYLLQQATVSGVDVKRGSKEWKRGDLSNVRFSRKPSGQNKIGIWEWKSNPFFGTKEFNGLRVMMAVMNNWDLKDVNNSIYSDKKTGMMIFLVNDVGASFGSNGLGWTRARSKGNVDSFRDSKFIQRMTDSEVDFSTPKRPTGMFLASAGTTIGSYSKRAGLSASDDRGEKPRASFVSERQRDPSLCSGRQCRESKESLHQ